MAHKRYVVVGLGNFGSAVCESLYRRGNEVIAVDLSENAVDHIAPHVTRSALADGTDAAVLRRVGGEKADAGIVATGDDISASILATMALKDIGVEAVYAKVISAAHDRVMRKLGVEETVFPERDSAINLVARISGKALLNYVKLSEDFGVQEMAVPDAWDKKSLRQLDLRRRYGVLVIAVHDVLVDQMRSPDPDEVLTESDGLLVAGRVGDLEKVAQLR